MDLLQLCAQKYAAIIHMDYTIARKNTAIDLHFTFSPYEFRHLAGLVVEVSTTAFAATPSVYSKTFSCKLTLADLRQAILIGAPRAKIPSRLEAFQLDTLMDELLLLYYFREKLAAQTPPLRTKIDADSQ